MKRNVGVPVPATLLNATELAQSAVVANCRMNRERQLMGVNSYERELGLPTLTTLGERGRPFLWVDLCCGTGQALIDAAAQVQKLGHTGAWRLEGIDLVGMFAPNPYPEILSFRQANVEQWPATESCSLITCVHGLHYVGDKLGVISRALQALAPGGLLLAHLDLDSIRLKDGGAAGRQVKKCLRDAGCTYHTRRRLLEVHGPQSVDFGLRYLGADDQAGPNYTGQPAVNSYYEAC